MQSSFTRTAIWFFWVSVTGLSQTQAQPSLVKDHADLERRIQAIRAVPPYKQWKLLGAFDLSKTAQGPVDTGHTQGLSIVGDSVAVSAKRHKFGEIVYYQLNKKNDHLVGVTYRSTTEFKDHPGLNHPGGMSPHEKSDDLIVPVANGYFGPTAILVTGRDRAVWKELVKVPFHVGALFYEATRHVVYGIDSHQGLHAFDPAKPEKNAASIPACAGAAAYQDCKSLGGEGYFLCAGKMGFNLFTLHGAIDLVHIKDDGTYETKDNVRIPVPRVDYDGRMVDETGTYIPNFLGYVTLAYNAFDFDISADGKSVIFYFAPNDNPNTHLYVYEASLKP